MTHLRPAVFLDRDGTVVVEKDYLSDPAEVALVPGAGPALRRLADAGYLLVIVTNQSGIARGIYDEGAYRAVTRRMTALLDKEGVALDGVKHCPHHPEHTGPCDCRKPATGMHREAASELGIDASASWFVGDKASDVLPAAELGGRGILVLSGYGAEERTRVPPDVAVVEDLDAAAVLILEGSGAPSRTR